MVKKMPDVKETHQAPGYAIEERLFQSLDTGNKGYLLKKQFIDALKRAGIDAHHLCLQPAFEKLNQLHDNSKISLDKFVELTRDNLTLIRNTLTGGLIIPDFQTFCNGIEEIYQKILPLKDGHVATYIPQLARVNPNLFSISVCTIDGQMFSAGDADALFSVQSTCKPINYCLAQKEHGEEIVHKYIGKEPSGHRFNVLRLNKENIPHNPFINAGAIMACALIQRNLDPADRFDYIMETWKDLCGGLKPGFNNAVYLSEKNSADRNFAIAHFMQEKKAFPKNTSLDEVLEFYFQCCSIELSTRQLSIVAATLANAGTCPLTRKEIFNSDTVKNCLSLMYSCGLYDFSGEFAFTVGLPAKSGVSGPIMLVIPSVMGLCVWSPPLDHYGNSVRGVAFCRELVNRYNFHNYDSMVSTSHKQDPRRKKNDNHLSGVLSLIMAASHGDLFEIQRLIAVGINLDEADYDGRTALHLASSEGQEHVVRYLLQKKVFVNPVDRWGGKPLTDALRGKHEKVVRLLKEHGAE